MKKYNRIPIFLFICILIVLSQFCNAQDSTKTNWISVHTAYTIKFDGIGSRMMDDIAIKDFRNNWLLGLGYERVISKKVNILSGIELSRYNYKKGYEYRPLPIQIGRAHV